MKHFAGSEAPPEYRVNPCQLDRGALITLRMEQSSVFVLLEDKRADSTLVGVVVGFDHLVDPHCGTLALHDTIEFLPEHVFDFQ